MVLSFGPSDCLCLPIGAATRAGGKGARNLAIIIMGRGRHEHVDPHTREAFQATPCSLVQQFWHMHAGPQQAIIIDPQ